MTKLKAALKRARHIAEALPWVLRIPAEDYFIETASGRRFWLRDPDPGAITIDDIATSLSKICRYTGHCAEFYSVAEHSLHMARYAYRTGLGPEIAMQCLLHDAHEAYVGDHSYPAKRVFPAFKMFDRRVVRAISDALGFEIRELPEVRHLDRLITLDERRLLMSRTQNIWQHDLDGLGGPDNAGLGLEAYQVGMSHQEARATFLMFYSTLSRFLD